MTLNGAIAVTLRNFTEFCKLALQHITASARIELIDQKSASVFHAPMHGTLLRSNVVILTRETSNGKQSETGS